MNRKIKFTDNCLVDIGYCFEVSKTNLGCINPNYCGRVACDSIEEPSDLAMGLITKTSLDWVAVANFEWTMRFVLEVLEEVADY